MNSPQKETEIAISLSLEEWKVLYSAAAQAIKACHPGYIQTLTGINIKICQELGKYDVTWRSFS